jgi:predicted CoA-substrate-specific enzyme activase
VTECTAGIDVGSTYTKAVVLGPDHAILGRAMRPTGFQLSRVAEETLAAAAREAGVAASDVAYTVATGFGRHQVKVGDVKVTDLTAAARGATLLFPRTRTILDVGGQTMKASRLDGRGRVAAFRLNDKCAAGTGAFLEKTARYLGFRTEQIGPLAVGSSEAASISGVCAVFAESEVINHVTAGRPPADILHGAMVSLVTRCVQLIKRVKLEPEIALVGGIMRYPTMIRVLKEQLAREVNVPDDSLAQMTGAIGAAVLGRQRLAKAGAAA